MSPNPVGGGGRHNFHIKIMSNKRVRAFQIAIPLDFEVAINSSIEAVCQALKLYLLPEN